jgi:hypothetical protein
MRKYGEGFFMSSNLAASIFTLKIEAVMSPNTLVSYFNSTWDHNPENLDLNLHHCEISNVTQFSVWLYDEAM